MLTPPRRARRRSGELLIIRRAQVRVLPGPLLTADEVAELLGVPKSWVYEQSRCGRIPTVTLGRYRRYRLEAIEAWLEELEDRASGRRRRAV